MTFYDNKICVFMKSYYVLVDTSSWLFDDKKVHNICGKILASPFLDNLLV